MTDPAPRSDELSLVDILLVLVRHRLLIAVACGLGMAGGAAYTLLENPVHESRAVVAVGKLTRIAEAQRQNCATEERLEPDAPADVLARLSNLHGWADRGRPLPYIASARMADDPDPIIVFTAVGQSPDSARDAARDAAQRFVEHDRARFDALVGAAEACLRTIVAERMRLEQLSGLLRRQTELAADPIRAAILAAGRAGVLHALADIRARESRLRNTRPDGMERPTHIVRAPGLAQRPGVARRMLRNLVLSAAVGVTAGLFAAFAAELVARERGKQSAAVRP